MTDLLNYLCPIKFSHLDNNVWRWIYYKIVGIDAIFGKNDRNFCWSHFFYQMSFSIKRLLFFHKKNWLNSQTMFSCLLLRYKDITSVLIRYKNFFLGIMNIIIKLSSYLMILLTKNNVICVFCYQLIFLYMINYFNDNIKNRNEYTTCDSLLMFCMISAAVISTGNRCLTWSYYDFDGEAYTYCLLLISWPGWFR